MKKLFITHDSEGRVTAYSDGPRNASDLKDGEAQVQTDLDFTFDFYGSGDLLTWDEDKLYRTRGKKKVLLASKTTA